MEVSESVLVDSRKNIHTLQIKELRREHGGRYVIKARNESGAAEASVILDVDVAPFVICALPERVEVRENATARLECEIGGVPVPGVAWSKKGEELVCGKESRLEMICDGLSNILMVDNARMGDAGIYSVSAANRVGKCSSKTELVVLVEPRFVRKIHDTQVGFEFAFFLSYDAHF